jgi:hypothetical protein
MANFGPPGSTPPPPPMPGPPPLSAQAQRPPRPFVVTLAGGLMLFEVVLSLLGAAILLLNRDLISDAAKKQIAKQGTDAPTVNVDTLTTITVFAGVAYAVIIAFLALAMFVLRGANVARIVTWVVCGLFICCSAYGVFGIATTIATYPGWYAAYATTNAVLSLLIYIGVIVLLLLPASTAYFKPKPQGQLY